MAQQYGTTLDTALAIFPRLRYDMANGANINTQLGPVYTKIELKASTQSRQDKGEFRNMAEHNKANVRVMDSFSAGSRL